MMATRPTVSRHEVLVFRFFEASPSTWFSNREVAAQIDGVTYRTVRAHTLKLRRLGVLDEMATFPGYRYRLAPKARQQNRAYVDRLREAATVWAK